MEWYRQSVVIFLPRGCYLFISQVSEFQAKQKAPYQKDSSGWLLVGIERGPQNSSRVSYLFVGPLPYVFHI